jgi:alpha,alpha-trehalase
MSIPSFVEEYNNLRVKNTVLDEYFRHDRAVRESGHDTTYRLDGRAADVATIDLHSCLYKYESDIAAYLETRMEPFYVGNNKGPESTEAWREAAKRRKAAADALMWDEESGMYYDWDVVKKERSRYESATTFWPLWSGMASDSQAKRMVEEGALKKFEVAGGLLSGTLRSAQESGPSSLDRPNRQWDYPCGWAPHQMLAWEGLERYGYQRQARRLAYRWAFMICQACYDYNGVVPEKFDVVRMSHKVTAEYGNVGTGFKLAPREGFGWMNASFLTAYCRLERLERRALRALVSPESLSFD